MEPKTKDLKPIEGIAVIAAGITAIVLPFVASIAFGAKFASYGFIIDAALLYLYQLYVFNLPDDWTDTDAKAVTTGAGVICAVWFLSLLLLFAGI